jgi:hypothetical protein
VLWIPFQEQTFDNLLRRQIGLGDQISRPLFPGCNVVLPIEKHLAALACRMFASHKEFGHFHLRKICNVKLPLSPDYTRPSEQT